MINDFGKVLEYMDKILNNKYILKIMNGLEFILKYIEIEKDTNKLDTSVNFFNKNLKFFLVHQRNRKIKIRKK